MSNPTPTGQDDARRALADKIEHAVAVYGPHHGLVLSVSGGEIDLILAALRAPSLDRGAEEWNYDMEAAPKGQTHRVLVTVPSIHEGEEPIVGEAWYCTEESHEGWWWSGTSPLHWHDAPLSGTNAEPIAWRHLPKPAALAQQAKGEGEGGDHG